MDVGPKRKVEVLYFAGCPNHRATIELVRRLVRQLGVSADIEEVEVTSMADAERLRFLGSPGVRVDGVDIEPGARTSTAYGFACRTYDGAGTPPRGLLVDSLGGGSQPMAKLRDEFNRTPDGVRVVSLVSPTCLVCQYGAGTVRTVLDVMPEDSLSAVVAWIPMMDSDSVEEARREATLFPSRRVAHVWDGNREVGDAFAQALKLKGTAWDVYMVYAPGVVWRGEMPPVPTFWMHQLPTATEADPSLLLVPRRFAEETARLLGRNVAFPDDLALFLHAKGLDAVRAERRRPTIEDVAAVATAAPSK